MDATETCQSCNSAENLTEYSRREASGGQFCGGDWYVCQNCDERAKKFTQWMKSDEFLYLVYQVNKERSNGSNSTRGGVSWK